jgi:hypothetical protein
MPRLTFESSRGACWLSRPVGLASSARPWAFWRPIDRDLRLQADSDSDIDPPQDSESVRRATAAVAIESKFHRQSWVLQEAGFMKAGLASCSRIPAFLTWAYDLSCIVMSYHDLKLHMAQLEVGAKCNRSSAAGFDFRGRHARAPQRSPSCRCAKAERRARLRANRGTGPARAPTPGPVTAPKQAAGTGKKRANPRHWH